MDVLDYSELVKDTGSSEVFVVMLTKLRTLGSSHLGSWVQVKDVSSTAVPVAGNITIS